MVEKSNKVGSLYFTVSLFDTSSSINSMSPTMNPDKIQRAPKRCFELLCCCCFLRDFLKYVILLTCQLESRVMLCLIMFFLSSFSQCTKFRAVHCIIIIRASFHDLTACCLWCTTGSLQAGKFSDSISAALSRLFCNFIRGRSTGAFPEKRLEPSNTPTPCHFFLRDLISFYSL